MRPYPLTKQIGLFLGPLVFCLLQVLPIEFISTSADIVISVAIWMLFLVDYGSRLYLSNRPFTSGIIPLVQNHAHG